jgi:hypothetical protein
MRRVHPAPLLLALAGAILPAAAARAQTIPFDLEIGYRFLSVSGSEDSYRSQIDERQGFLVRGIHFESDGLKEGSGFFDHLQIDGSDLGAGPAGSLRVDVGRAGAYRLRATYRHQDQFSALPGFANPLGAPTGQQTWDRTRDMVDVDLEILPWAAVTPLLGYSFNSMTGPGDTTTFVGQDEFRLHQDLRVRDQEFHVGARFDAGPFSGEVLQGWRRYHEVENDSLLDGTGNDQAPLLGQTLNLATFARSSTTDVDAPTTSVLVRGFALPSVKVIGFFVRTSATAAGADQEGLSGSLVSFPLSRFFTGLTDSSVSGAENMMWRLGGRVEWQALENIDVTGGFVRRHTVWDGQDLVNSLYSGTSGFTGFTLADLQTLLNAQTSVERIEDVFDVQISAKVFGPFSVRAGYSHIRQDLTVTEDPSEIIVPGGQGGEFTRNIDRLEGALTWRTGPFFAAAEASVDNADRSVLRIDYLRRNRERLRATWKGFSWVTVGATGLWVDQSNDTSGIDSKGSSRQFTGDVTLRPLKFLRLHGAFSRLQADSSIPIRAPQDFSVLESVDTENGQMFEGGVGLTLAKFAIDGFWSRFTNSGSASFRLYRGGARASFDATKHVGFVAEWSVDRYLDQQLATASFRADRLGVSLALHP